jgi:hypothetical protein
MDYMNYINSPLNKIVHEYHNHILDNLLPDNIFVITTFIPVSDKDICLRLTLLERDNDVKIHIMYNIDVIGVYENGVASFELPSYLHNSQYTSTL